jgi:GWxTD domain-containing protein
LRATSSAPSPSDILRRLGTPGLLLVIGLFLCVAAAQAQPRRPSRLTIDATVATRFEADGAVTAVVHVALPRRHLVYRRDGESFASTLQVSVVAEAHGRRVGGGFASVNALAPDYDATRSDEPVRCAVDVTMPGSEPVVLKLKATVAGTSRFWERDLEYDPGAAGSVPFHFTGFAWNLDGADGRERIVGGETDTVSVTLTLSANPSLRDNATTADLIVLVRNPQDQEQILGSMRLGPDDGDIVVRRASYAASDLPFGPLVMTARIAATDGESLDLTPGRDFVNLSVPWNDAEAWRRHVGWLEGLVDGDARRVMNGTSPAGRRRAWREVWDQRLPGARPTEREHLLRIVDADERFSRFGRGALSDQGRVYIQNGPPDRMETHEPDMSYPGIWQIWYYREIGLLFRFYDAFGLGDFRLYDTAPY